MIKTSPYRALSVAGAAYLFALASALPSLAGNGFMTDRELRALYGSFEKSAIHRDRGPIAERPRPIEQSTDGYSPPLTAWLPSSAPTPTAPRAWSQYRAQFQGEPGFEPYLSAPPLFIRPDRQPDSGHANGGFWPFNFETPHSPMCRESRIQVPSFFGGLVWRVVSDCNND